MARSKKGIVGTIVFHAGLLVFAILFGFATPLPLPEEEGILINFGTDDFGAGDQEPMFSEIPEASNPPPQEAARPTESKEEIISQDFEEAPVVTEKPQEKPQVEKREEVITPEKITKPVEEIQPPPPEKEPPKVNERALYKGRKDTDATGSEGITKGEGNQGGITGSPDSDNYADGLSTGGGGINFSLAGRNPVSLPKPEYNAQVSGTIVVRIRVDREGKVISAEPGYKGTNILDENLLEAARKAALKARFNSTSDAAYTQAGTITYHFVLQ
jgi:colicin import membrane protein